MRKIILCTALAGSLLFATPAYGEVPAPAGQSIVIETPQKTIVINMINLERPTEKRDSKGYTVKGYGKTWKAFIPNADSPSNNHDTNGFEKPRNSDESFKFQQCGE
jgi:hypothetical protein